jgi:hypothetical protein
MYSMSSVESSVSEMSGALYASIGVGSNGDLYGTPTDSIGDDQGEENWDYTVWDSDPSDGFTTSNIPVIFTASTNGNESLEGIGDGISYGGDAFSKINSVELQAGVTQCGEAKWTDVNVAFYNGTTLGESDSIEVGPDANTTNTPSSPQAQQILTVTPTSSNYTSVVVSGTLKLTAPGSGVPNPNGMFCNIFINGS